MFTNIKIGRYFDYRDWFIVDSGDRLADIYFISTEGDKYYVGRYIYKEYKEKRIFFIHAIATQPITLKSMMYKLEDGNELVEDFTTVPYIEPGNKISVTVKPNEEDWHVYKYKHWKVSWL